MKISHRDLKPQNILLHINGTTEEANLASKPCEQIVLKIGDLGGAKSFEHSMKTVGTSTVGTFHYMAPEVVRLPS
ncbi:hypothetical protein RvY_15070 [Ramazzottius varieornatus]|uniref:IkappaB kinase n=1 Tax=Ramazzottius varieornatus TaxID=947166 RepID=A0A1D1VYF0_RAMVA|nr:hypothetical protein RvY_15070 [Ramazzottius varieornatus]